MEDMPVMHDASHDQSSASILGILSVYSGLRRQGSTAEEALSKLESLILQLSAADRRELDSGIQDWETKRGKQADEQAAREAGDPFNKTPPPRVPAAPDVLEESTVSAATVQSMLQRMQPTMNCAKCGKPNDMAAEQCVFCGNSLKAAELPPLQSTQDVTWFGPNSRLQLFIKGTSQSIEVAVHNTITLGRHTPQSSLSDIDLSPYRADELGVSRLHASIKRQGSTLILADMRSTNHTFINSKRVGEAEAVTLKHGDEIAVGTLKLTVAFLHEKIASHR